jgi:hypothetical protein
MSTKLAKKTVKTINEPCAGASNGMGTCTLAHQHDGIACLVCRPALAIELAELACEFADDDEECSLFDLQMGRACEMCVVRYGKVGAL